MAKRKSRFTAKQDRQAHPIREEEKGSLLGKDVDRRGGVIKEGRKK